MRLFKKNFLGGIYKLSIKNYPPLYIFLLLIILLFNISGCINQPNNLSNNQTVNQPNNPTENQPNDQPVNLASPSDLMGVPVSSSELYLTWKDNSNNEANFNIERATDSNFNNNFTSILVDANTTSYTDSNLSNIEYFYRIKAIKGTSESGYSNTSNISPEDIAQPTAKATFECLGLYWSPAVGASDNECKIKYRALGNSTWKDALSLWYDGSNNEYRGSIVNLNSGTTYEVLFTLQETGTSTIITASTWSETYPIAQIISVPNQSTTLNVTNSNSGSPSGYILYIAANPGDEIDVNNNQDFCVTIDAHHVIVRGLTLKGARTHAIRLYNAQDVVIENCDITNWGTNRTDGWGYDYNSAIFCDDQGGNVCQRLIIQNNKMHHPRSDANSWHEYRDITGEGYHPVGPQAITLFESQGNHIIRYNEIYSDDTHYFNDGIGGGNNFGTKGAPGADSDIYSNIVSNCWDDGIESEGGNCNVRIWGNFIKYTYVKIACATVSIGPLYVWRNVTSCSRYYDNTWTEDQTNQGILIKMDGEKGQGRIYVFHNTLLQPPAFGTIVYPLGVSHGLFGNQIANTVTRNNLFQLNRSSSIGSFIGDDDYPNHPYCEEVSSYDYDLFNGNPYATIISGEAHGLFTETPIYNQTPSYDLDSQGYGIFTLDQSSPGFDAGVIIPNFNDDYLGTAPDMGAHEAGTSSMKFGVRN